MTGDVGTELLIIALLILLNGVFVAAEIALVTVRRSRLQALVDEGHGAARHVQRLVGRPGRFLAVIQLGITFIGFLAAAFAGANTAVRLRDVFNDVFPAIGAEQAEVAALLVVTLLVSLVTIIFGELVPKTLALAHAERYALLFARPVEVLGRIFRPVVWLLTAVTDVVTRLLGVRDISSHDRFTTEELMILVERGGEQGVIEAEEEQMIGAVLELGERRVHEVMVPRIDIIAVPTNATLDELVDVIVKEGHSRIPVYDTTIDNVVGILYAKDLLPYLKGSEPPPLRRLLRTPLEVPESMSVDDLLHAFQRRKVHLAIVLDEYGGTAGLVTIEDLIEEIVGEIQDEYDVEEPMIEKLSDTEARIDGRASVDDLAETFDIDLDGTDSEEYDTVGGLVYHEVGGVPQVGDTVEVDGLTLTVESTNGRRVGKVLAVLHRERDDGQPDRSDD